MIDLFIFNYIKIVFYIYEYFIWFIMILKIDVIKSYLFK